MEEHEAGGPHLVPIIQTFQVPVLSSIAHALYHTLHQLFMQFLCVDILAL